MNTIKTLLAVFCLAAPLFWSSCSDNDHDGPEFPDSGLTPLTGNQKVIYEVHIRNYSASGDFAGLEKDLPRLQELGVDILWLMPIHPIGEQNRIGSAGSPYSVKDYKAIHPDYGTADELKSLVRAAHEAGMEIWLDWVANHTSWDHVWTREHPDYYAEKDGDRPYSPEGWTDVIQLDYNNDAMREAMIDAMKYWVQEFDIDGFRCDAATFVPLSFWQEARQAVDAVKKISWLCEGDNAGYMEVFDCDYAWNFNDRLNDFGKGGKAGDLITACEKLTTNPAYARKSRMVYLTNHDLNAYHGTEFARYGNNVLPLTVLYFTVYDMPLIYNGQEIGMNKAMSLTEPDPVQWDPANSLYFKLFQQLIRLKHTQPALESGADRGMLKRYPTNREEVFVYSRIKEGNEVLVMLNLAPVPVKFRFTNFIPGGKFRNYLQSGERVFQEDEGVVLPANGYAVYVK